jgi:glycosyltransferase involved in cell wall biosynthesis
MTKRVLIFSLAYYPHYVSGAEAAVKEITDRIDEGEYEFHLITHLFEKTAPRVEKIGNVTVYRVGFGGGRLSKMLFVPLAALKARDLHKTLRFSGMWAMMTYMLMPLTLARLIGVRIPYALTLQDGDPYEKVFERTFIKPFLPLIDKGFRDARIIQVISEYLGTWPEKRGYKGEVVMVRNGANPNNFEQLPREQLEEVKKQIGKKEGDLYLFIAARLEYQKGIDAIIKALPLLPDTVKFLIAGGGSEEIMLKDLTKELSLEDRVMFLGSLQREDVPKYRNTVVADIFVHPSRSEGLGNSVLSAMAGRLPVIATQVGGLADFIFDGTDASRPATAWAVQPDSPEQIAAAVKDILANPEKVKERTENARAMVEREYRWEQIAEDMKVRVFASLAD